MTAFRPLRIAAAFAALAVCLTATAAFADTTAFVRVQRNSPDPGQHNWTVAGGFDTAPLALDSVGFTTFWAMSPNWGEVYAGPYWKMGGLYVSAGIGVQQFDGLDWARRYGASARLDGDLGYLSAVAEGDDRFLLHGHGRTIWYELTAAKSVVDSLNVGLRATQGIGLGLMVERTFFGHATPIVAWLPYNLESAYDGRAKIDLARGYVAAVIGF